jgi:hypothetical protein
MELGARILGRAPLANRAMARQVGRYFWVDDSKAAALGYTARPLTDTLAATLAWWLDSAHAGPKWRACLAGIGADYQAGLCLFGKSRHLFADS